MGRLFPLKTSQTEGATEVQDSLWDAAKVALWDQIKLKKKINKYGIFEGESRSRAVCASSRLSCEPQRLLGAGDTVGAG